VKDFVLTLLAQGIVMAAGLTIVAAWLSKQAHAGGQLIDNVLGRVFGEERGEQIEDKLVALVDDAWRRVKEGLDADDAE